MASSSLLPIPNLFSINIKDLVQVNLDFDNYLSWKHLILPVLDMHGLKGHIDGSNPLPPATIIDSDRRTVPNPAYYEWLRHDALVLSWMNATIKHESLPLLFDVKSAKAAWDVLQEHFLERSIAREMYLRNCLQSLKKNYLSIEEYMQKMKHFADLLAAIGRPISASELCLHVYQGLPPQYESFITYASNKTPQVTFKELWPMLLSQEAMLAQIHANSSYCCPVYPEPIVLHGQPPCVGMSGCYGSNSCTFPRGKVQYLDPCYQESCCPCRDVNAPNSKVHVSHDDHHQPKQVPTMTHQQILCQICEDIGHLARECSRRFDQAYQGQNQLASQVAVLPVSETGGLKKGCNAPQ